MAPQVIILMADYGNDPTEVATPFTEFKKAGFDVTFATETGNVPRCDERMLSGMTQVLLVSHQAYTVVGPRFSNSGRELQNPQSISMLRW